MYRSLAGDARHRATRGPALRADGDAIRTYNHDTVLRIPASAERDDNALLAALADEVTDLVTGFDELAITTRQSRIEQELSALAERYRAGVPA